MSIKRNALGRGLSALLENADTDVTANSGLPGTANVAGSINNIPIHSIEANPFQPRTDFEEQPLLELADSIRKQGIIQPLTVRKLGYDKYQLISGERRLRASKIAGLKEVPAYIRIANDQAMLEMALVENIQRENLNPIEVSISYQRLMDECSFTQEQLSERVGKNRSTITNYLRLMKLPPEIQTGIRDLRLSMGHARALINIDDIGKQLAIFKTILDEELSVRQTEELARNAGKKVTTTKPVASKPALDIDLLKIRDTLASKYEAKIELKQDANGKGKIVIPYVSNDDLNRILDLLDY